MLLALFACSQPAADEGLPCAVTGDCLEGGLTDEPSEDDGDEGSAGRGGGSSGEQDEDDDEDDGAPTGASDPKTCEGVTFVTDGERVDLTAAFEEGELVRLKEAGTLEVCPGSWFAWIAAAGEITIAGLGEEREDTVLSGGEQLPVLTVSGGRVELVHLVVDRGAAWSDGAVAAGGGVRCQDAELVIEDVTLSANQAYDGAAGLVGEGCELSLRNADVVDNVATDDGGAFRISEGGQASFEDVRFAGNSARDGGALAVFEGTARVVTTVFEDNTASDHGGAIVNWYGQLELDSSVLQENLARFGGGLAIAGPTTLERVSLWRQSAKEGGAILYQDARLEGFEVGFLDNTPDDLRVQGSHESVVWDETVDFTCDGGRCWEG